MTGSGSGARTSATCAGSAGFTSDALASDALASDPLASAPLASDPLASDPLASIAPVVSIGWDTTVTGSAGPTGGMTPATGLSATGLAATARRGAAGLAAAFGSGPGFSPEIAGL